MDCRAGYAADACDLEPKRFRCGEPTMNPPVHSYEEIREIVVDINLKRVSLVHNSPSL